MTPEQIVEKILPEKKQEYEPTDEQVGNGAYYDLREIKGYNQCREESRQRLLDTYGKEWVACNRNDVVSVESMADLMHTTWSGWIKYMFKKSKFRKDGTIVIPAWAVERWSRQAETAYEQLSEEEKESDRVEARKVIALIPTEWVGVPSVDELIELAQAHCRELYEYGTDEYNEKFGCLIYFIKETLAESILKGLTKK